MIKWILFIPLTALGFVLYFQYIDALFRGKKKIFKIDLQAKIKATPNEVRNTLLNLCVFAAVGGFIGFSIDQGWTKVYSNVSFTMSEITYLIASFFLALAVHDIYFYLCHRMLHLPVVFKFIHVWHHRSHEANSWSAFSFHPVEGIFQIGIVVILAFLLPVHEVVLMLFTGFMLFISVYGHCGYELRPNKWKGFTIFNTSLHHYQHHTLIRYNFGIYLNIWDKLFASEFPEYDQSFEDLGLEIKKRKAVFKDSSHAK